MAGVFLPREEALLAVVPGLRAEAVLAPFLVVIVPFFAVEALFLAAVFLAGAFFWAADAPSALQASTIIAAMAAQLKIFLMDSIASVSIPLHKKRAGRRESGPPKLGR